MRIKAVIAYDGSRFEGFQSQKHTQNTVMGLLQKTLHNLGITGQIVGSGRTDRGVHATAQVIHFDLPSFWELERFGSYFQRNLGPFVQLRRLSVAPAHFHARFDAKSRAYRYILSSTPPSPFEAAYLCYEPHLNKELITQALKLFEGRHDFGYFMKTGSDTKTSIRTIFRTAAYEHKRRFVLYIEGDAFLRAQVRMMVAFLLKISRGELTIAQLKEQLAKEARHSTTLAPPGGLYLCRVVYSTKAALI